MDRVAKTLIFVIAFVLVQLNDVQSDTCSYENCPAWKDDMLNIHLVCHTHDDAGWLKTVAQYFWGSNLGTSGEGVQYILDSVTRELKHDPAKRFSYCETGFFWRWLLTNDDAARADALNLIANGQLEIIGGGWVQQDEAATHYVSIIDQMTFGHRFLNESFGRCAVPRAAWQIDPFGHSRESASLFAQMGLESLFFARLHYADRAQRKSDQTMEMLWRGSDDLGSAGDIITSAFYNHYSAPPGFCFDDQCQDEPIIDDPRLEEYNADQRVDEFISYAQKQAKAYQTNHILITMGDDFDYMNAGRNFASLDRLIRDINARQSSGSNIQALYSTPACYTKAIKEAGIKLQPKTDDFFPYADSNHAYWTGYFTSRPSLKGAVRTANNILQACQSIDAVAALGSDDFNTDINNLHQAIGTLQHHDAVTGTAKQHVTNDYMKMLHTGQFQCQQVFNDALGQLAPKIKKNDSPPYQTFCFNLNASVCNVTQNEDNFIVTVYNGRGQPLDSYLRLPVSGQAYDVTDPQGQLIDPKPQVQTTFGSDQLPGGITYGPQDLIFPISVPGFGYSTYYVTKTASERSTKLSQLLQGKRRSNDDLTIANEYVKVEFDSASGLVQTVTDLSSGQAVPVKQNFYWYESYAGGDQPSGAYIFRPKQQTPKEVTSGPVSATKVDGEWVQEVRQVFSDWVTQTVRLYKNKPYVEFEWTVGPIPDGDQVGKEVINRFDTSIASKGVFWTDSNGRQLLNRTRDYQPTYQYSDDEPVSGNYYPVNSIIAIKDLKTQLTIVNDRAQGGSSVQDGSVELMVHRRLFQDDYRGVGEALNEPGDDGRGLVVRGKHWLLLSTPSNAAGLYREYAQEIFYQPVPTFAPLSGSFDAYRKQFSTTASGTKSDLPANVNFLTLAQLNGDPSSILLRVEHLYQKGEDSDLSQPVTINLQDYLASFDISKAEELSLSANTVLDPSVDPTSITLQPFQIRTFRLTVNNNDKLTSKIRTRGVFSDRFRRLSGKTRQ